MEKNGGWGFFQSKELVSPTKIFGWTRQSQWEMVRSVIKQLSFNKLWHFHEQCLLPWLHFWHIYLQSICLRGKEKPFSWPVIWMHSILCWVQSSTISTFNLCTYCNFLWTSFLLSKYYFAISKCIEYSLLPQLSYFCYDLANAGWNIGKPFHFLNHSPNLLNNGL